MRRAKFRLGGVLQGPYRVLLGQRSCIVLFAAVALG